MAGQIQLAAGFRRRGGILYPSNPMHLISRFALLLAVAPAVAQSRSTVLVGPPALGATFSVQHIASPMVAGQLAGFLWSGPYAGAQPVISPGLSVNGLLRVDPASMQMLGLTLTDGVTAPQMQATVPASGALIGVQLDCQSFDVNATWIVELASNDVTATVAAGPSPLLNMVLIAPGTFQMGSNLISSNEQPVHQVTLTMPFWMGKYEVTQAEYQAVMGFNSSYFQGPSAPNASQRPVESVGYGEAIAYCDALTTAEQAAGRLPQGYRYRLPTEAEWEYCCRAGTTTEWNTGTSLNTSQANISGALATSVYPLGQTATVGSYAPNAFGLHDMHGNVWEWCLDSFTLYSPGAVTDPFLCCSSYGLVFRGGSFSNGPIQSAFRLYNPIINMAFIEVGFRIVLGPILVP
jgi:formylglycine-generating enzyme required for sulfatase activity